MKLKRNILIALVLLFSSLYTVGQTLAAPYYATYYTSAGNRIAFMLDGTAQSGGDIVQVNNILTSPTFNGTAANIPSATLQSWSNFLFSDNTTPALSFSGNTLNFFWGDPNIAANEAIIFDDSTLTAFGAPIFAGGASFGNTLEAFNANNWSLTQYNRIPEPATNMLIMLGMAGLFLLRRRYL